VAQTVPDAQALIVTTPQEISLADVRKSINFCRQVDMRILGLVENMSGLICPGCGERIDLFKRDGGRVTAKRENLTLLASLPIEPEVVDKGDAGGLEKMIDSDHAFNREFQKMVETIVGPMKSQAPAPSPSEKRPEIVDAKDKVIIAVPVAGGKLCAHFGHCEHFALVEAANGKIVGKTLHTPPPHEPGVLPKWLHDKGAHIVIAGGMGSRAQQLFTENGIQVITGAPMDAPEALAQQYLSDTLVTGSNVCDH